ncbi:protein TCL1B4 isoform 1 [Mus musculus]|nr:protein TCL1B4 isoform 1 [Mus musculus]AAI45149.1 Tcl1b4 protein [Mus musculus]AAI45789.1 Tcl1b4 protein [Mus musculus]|eukprot:XP_006515999.1 PREDICTED: protein TCL1B4 isoform X1 [Mus musculus]
MADSVRFPCMPFPPCFLVCTRDDIYEDEHGRQWVAAKVETSSHSPYCSKIETCVTVHLWQMTTLFQEPSPDSLKTFNFLPRTWRLESRNTYRGADAMHWRLVNHSQFYGTEELVLMLDSRS